MIGTFLPQVPEIIISDSKNKINIFTQLEQPETFNGIWIQTEDQYENVITDSEWFFGGEFDKTSDFVKNLCNAIRTITYPTASTYPSAYIKSFLKYLNDYYIIIQKEYSNYLYKIIIDEESNISLSQIYKFSGYFEQIFQFGEDNKYIMWSGNVTGNGSSNQYAYVYNLDTNKLTSLASNIGFIASYVIYMDKLFVTKSDSYYSTLYIANIDLINPTSLSLTYCDFKLFSYSSLILFRDKLLGMTYSSNPSITEICFDFDTSKVSWGEEIVSLKNDLDLTISGNDGKGDYNQRGLMFYTSNGLLFYFGGYYTSGKYFICDLKNKSLISKGLITDITYSVRDSIGICSDCGGGYGRLIEEVNGNIIGCLGGDGVLRYNVESKQYDEKTVILSKTDPISGKYYTEFVSCDDIEDFNEGIHLFKTGFNDILYFHNGSLDNTLPTYYGDGTQWIKFKN